MKTRPATIALLFLASFTIGCGRQPARDSKVAYAQHLNELDNATSAAMTKIKAGQIEDGVNMLHRVLVETRNERVYRKAMAAATEAGPIIGNEADELVREKKYFDAINAYAAGLRDYLMIAEVKHQPRLDSGADQLIKSLGVAARQGNTPASPFRILTEIIDYDPENKAAKLELSQVYLSREPADYSAAADLLEQAGGPSDQVKALRLRARGAETVSNQH